MLFIIYSVYPFYVWRAGGPVLHGRRIAPWYSLHIEILVRLKSSSFKMIHQTCSMIIRLFPPMYLCRMILKNGKFSSSTNYIEANPSWSRGGERSCLHCIKKGHVTNPLWRWLDSQSLDTKIINVCIYTKKEGAKCYDQLTHVIGAVYYLFEPTTVNLSNETRHRKTLSWFTSPCHPYSLSRKSNPSSYIQSLTKDWWFGKEQSCTYFWCSKANWHA